MCGIAGFAGFNAPGLIARMCGMLVNRGPDAEGIAELPQANMTLGMRRLAIIDLVDGNQPFVNHAKTVFLVFNGEIYNHALLRDELSSLGYSFKTRSDSEVILNAYLHWGEDAWQKLNGMFTIAIADLRDQVPKLLLVRDRAGIKPLYYLLQNGKLVFASEAKAIRVWDDFKTEINTAAIHNYLTLRYVPGPESLFQGIYKLPAAHSLVFQNNEILMKRWWSPPSSEGIDNTFDSYRAQQYFGEALTSAVQSHMMSDVPIGLFLSGGIDSSTIAALMAQASSTPIHTFSIGFKGFSGDEQNQAAFIAKTLGADHTPIVFQASDFAALPDVIWALDEPVGDAIIAPLYVLAREAQRKVKVVLSGEGADEILGGYMFHRKLVQLNKLCRHVPKSVWPIIAMLINITPHAILNRLFDYPGKLGSEGRRKLVSMVNLLKTADLEQLYYQSISLFDKHDILQLDHGNHLHQFADKPHGVNRLATHSTALQQLVREQFSSWLPDLILRKLDKITMAFSLEGRVPFLDEGVINAAATIADHHKLTPQANKKVLRDFAKTLLPKSVVDMPKAAFYIPLESYMEHPQVADLFRGMLDPVRLKRRGLIQPEWVKNTMNSPESAGFLPLKRLFAIVVLEMWFERFCPDASWA